MCSSGRRHARGAFVTFRRARAVGGRRLVFVAITPSTRPLPRRWGRELLPGGRLPSCFFVDDLFFSAYAAYHRATVYAHPWRRWLFREAKRRMRTGEPAFKPCAQGGCSPKTMQLRYPDGLAMGGVLDRLPDLRIGLAHGGGPFPFTIGRIAHGHAVRPDLCAVDSPTPPRDFLDRFVYDSLLHDAGALRHLVDLVGAERIAMGSDYPFPLGEHVPGALIRSIEAFDDATRDRLLGGTALEFLGLPVSAMKVDR